MRVEVENLTSGEIRHTSSAYLTFVAIDKPGNRVVVPQVIPETEEEKRRYEEAGERRAYRLAMREKALQKRR
jgi:acyl-CoA hydrolase